MNPIKTKKVIPKSGGTLKKFSDRNAKVTSFYGTISVHQNITVPEV
jgi:hypothetical protein